MIDIPAETRAGWREEAKAEGGAPLPGDTQYQTRLRYVTNRLTHALDALEEAEKELDRLRAELVELKVGT